LVGGAKILSSAPRARNERSRGVMSGAECAAAVVSDCVRVLADFGLE
jgi:hypothetical protein